ncbi:hypothetical protein [Actinoplanes sp. N902-109]|uniref:hypothetical protein n=1 Tax=Actinoplanes sp. (strain N902-109) TaxID=649831 RepID=UPI0003293667|nr:hypothetical protein [Actinoplanes sp. N902-109]AGL15872.1 hypothetical protein L083_2362 [Actinoplanes sp. N902-109]
MVEPHVTLDPSSLGPVEEKLRRPLEQQLTSAMKVATEKVSHDYSGEPVEQVATEILDETKAALHHDIADGFVPDQRELRRVAEAVVREN